jgi:serine/threonine protein kinase
MEAGPKRSTGMLRFDEMGSTLSGGALSTAAASDACRNVDVLYRQDVQEFYRMAIGIANGMAFLHSKQVVHRDLKPENVLLDEFGTAKLCDFGLSKLVDDSQLRQSGRRQPATPVRPRARSGAWMEKKDSSDSADGAGSVVVSAAQVVVKIGSKLTGSSKQLSSLTNPPSPSSSKPSGSFQGKEKAAANAAKAEEPPAAQAAAAGGEASESSARDSNGSEHDPLRPSAYSRVRSSSNANSPSSSQTAGSANDDGWTIVSTAGAEGTHSEKQAEPSAEGAGNGCSTPNTASTASAAPNANNPTFMDSYHASTYGTAGVGTPAYMAPEMFVNGGANLRKRQYFSPDVYSFGVLLWSMWTMR